MEFILKLFIIFYIHQALMLPNHSVLGRPIINYPVVQSYAPVIINYPVVQPYAPAIINFPIVQPYAPTTINYPVVQSYAPAPISYPAAQPHAPATINYPVVQPYAPAPISYPAVQPHAPATINYPVIQPYAPAPISYPAVQPHTTANRTIFRAYIGSNFNNVAFTDVPIHSDVEFHFILAFAIDYDTEESSPTNGNFNIFWDNDTLNPDEVIAIKKKHKNVKVVLSIGGDTCQDSEVIFTADSVNSWVSNAVSSLTKIIKEYSLDGIDIDYEHFDANPKVFAQCIGQLVEQLKDNGVISLASIAPYDDEDVQNHYQELWKSYSNVIDYVNFQFYAYDEETTVSQFMDYFEQQTDNYNGGKILASFATDGIGGGLSPENGFFEACKKLKSKGILAGIFIWSADDSKDVGFPIEKQSQALLASDGDLF